MKVEKNTSRFDWYQASVGISLGDVMDRCQEAVPDCRVERVKARNGYQEAYRVRTGEDQVMTILGGRGLDPHIVSSGPVSQWVGEMLRLWWDHSVSRVDACQDYDAGPGTWDSMESVIRSAVKDSRVHQIYIGPPPQGGDQPGVGRTMYFGAPSSAVRMRCYEKGLEVISKGGDASPSLVRLETQYRPPKRRMKVMASRLAPMEVMTVAPWTRDAVSAVEGCQFPRVRAPQPPEKNMDRTLAFMFRQYGRLLARKRDELGGPIEFGRWVNDQTGAYLLEHSDVPF